MDESAQIKLKVEFGRGDSGKNLPNDASTQESCRGLSPTGTARGDSGEMISRDVSEAGSCQRDSLERLSDRDLLAGLKRLRGTEREVQLGILYHLIEVERRRLYAAMGYGSLFEFCTSRIGYTSSSAGRRIRAARCIERFPAAAGLLRTGELSLCALSMLSGILTAENAGELLGQVRGRPLEEAELLVARQRPGRLVRDRVRPVFVRCPERAPEKVTRPGVATSPGQSQDTVDTPGCVMSAGQSQGTVNTPGFADAPPKGEKTNSTPSTGSEKIPTCQRESTGPAGAAGPQRVVVERRYKIEFMVEPAFMEKLQRIKSLLSGKYPQGMGLESVFSFLMEEYLARHSPEGRIERRRERERTKGKKGTKRSVPKRTGTKRTLQKATGTKRAPTSRTRRIPQRIRDEVYVRDGGRCTFVGPGGRRCGETRNLQVDHIVPYAKGGSSGPENLRLLCFKHNQLEAERAYGKDHIKKFNRRE